MYKNRYCTETQAAQKQRKRTAGKNSGLLEYIKERDGGRASETKFISATEDMVVMATTVLGALPMCFLTLNFEKSRNHQISTDFYALAVKTQRLQKPIEHKKKKLY